MGLPEKHRSHLSSGSGKLYNHNSNEILWLCLFSRDVFEIRAHTVLILEGEKNICKPERFEKLNCPRLMMPGMGPEQGAWATGHTEPGAPPADPTKI